MPGSSHLAIRVLIVDDSAQVRRDLRTVLALAGSAAGLRIEVAGEAENGPEAVRLAQAILPDVVLMDLVMPGMDGYAAARAIKAACPAVRVIALTVLDYASAGVQARLAGMDGFLEKGGPVAEIVRTIQSLLTGQTGRQNP